MVKEFWQKVALLCSAYTMPLHHQSLAVRLSCKCHWPYKYIPCMCKRWVFLLFCKIISGLQQRNNKNDQRTEGTILAIIGGGGSRPHLTYGSLGPPESTTQTASRSVHLFLQGSLLRPADRHTQTDPHYICSKRLHLCTLQLMHAVDPNNH